MKILLIDDSAMSRRMFRSSINEEHQFIEAKDGMEGLELYFLEKPDLVVLDITMPEMSGMEVLKKIKHVDPQARVLIGTADVQEASWNEAMNLGAVGFVTKPFTKEKVVEAVQKAIGV